MAASPSDTAPAAPPRPAWRTRIQRMLASPRAPWVIIAVALTLQLPSLSVGWVIDDHLLRVRIRAALSDTPSPLPVYPPTLWDIFLFVPSAPADKLEIIDEGGLNWMTDPRVDFRFFRPVSALTHVIDNVLWPESPPLQHAHNLMWLALLFVAVFALYRRVQQHAWVAGLSILLYALDDARAAAAAWISNRNALIAVLLGVLALIAHDRARRQAWRPGTWLGALALACSLLAGETGVGTFGYLLAHALVLDRAPLRSRLLALAPYLVVLATWAVTYADLGFGVRHSAFYVDPGSDPVRFLGAVANYVPILLASQLSGLWSDVCILLPDLVLAVVGVSAAIYLLLFLDTARRVVGRSRDALFWALGAALAAVPSAGVVPMDRNLTFIGIGVMGLLACFFAKADAPDLPQPRSLQRNAIRIWVVMLALANIVGAPLAVPLRVDGYRKMGAWIERGEASLPRVAGVERIVIAANPPTEAMLSYAPIIRASRGAAGPGRLRMLATGRSAVTLTREAAGTLLVRPDAPYLQLIGERLMRRDPFVAGQRVVLSGVTIEVTKVTAEGLPMETRWRFDRPLEDPVFIFLRWSDETVGFVPFRPPAIGQSMTLPGVDMLRAWLGS